MFSNREVADTASGNGFNIDFSHSTSKITVVTVNKLVQFFFTPIMGRNYEMEVNALEIINVFIADGRTDISAELRSFFSDIPRLNIIGECSDGELTVKMCHELQPDILIIDMDLPGMDALSVTDLLTSTIPNFLVIMTCARVARDNIKTAMSAGARDLIEKPVPPHNLAQRIISLYDYHRKCLSIAEKRDYSKLKLKHNVITIFNTDGGVVKQTFLQALQQKQWKKLFFWISIFTLGTFLLCLIHLLK